MSPAGPKAAAGAGKGKAIKGHAPIEAVTAENLHEVVMAVCFSLKDSHPV
ncbi:hypothetical protein ACKGML_05150 [Klebsiella pneumoniae]